MAEQRIFLLANYEGGRIGNYQELFAKLALLLATSESLQAAIKQGWNWDSAFKALSNRFSGLADIS